MKPFFLALAAALWITAASAAPMHTDPEFHDDAAVKLTDHVHMIEGMPNIAIVVGKAGTLVVDTGLGPKNGAVIARTAIKLRPGNKLYLTTTHAHPEHAAGEAGFPPGTVLIRARVQEEERAAVYQWAYDIYFKNAYPQWLEGVTFRKPDIIFDKQHDLDLGDVHVQLLWTGRAHTGGDETAFVVEDRVLISGDVVQNKTGPFFAETGGSPRAWIKTIDGLAGLHPKLIVPDHSAPAGEAVIAEQRAFLVELDERAQASKRKGVPAPEAGKTITAEMKALYTDWSIGDLTTGVVKAYAE
jgi:glyoxylase-like metal-dependent hydrolase (beta-lactamase superfamily II)